MSLNRTEQRLFDYMLKHAEERQYWQHKVQRIAAGEPDRHAAAHRLDAELWHYHRERIGVVPELRDAAGREGTARTSLKNLAEYLLRLWAPPPPKRPPSAGTSAGKG